MLALQDFLANHKMQQLIVAGPTLIETKTIVQFPEKGKFPNIGKI